MLHFIITSLTYSSLPVTIASFTLVHSTSSSLRSLLFFNITSIHPRYFISYHPPILYCYSTPNIIPHIAISSTKSQRRISLIQANESLKRTQGKGFALVLLSFFKVHRTRWSCLMSLSSTLQAYVSCLSLAVHSVWSMRVLSLFSIEIPNSTISSTICYIFLLTS